MQVNVKNDVSILSIREFLGLNENPDGDTTLKDGEMAEMRNFRITQDKHLQIRPGCKSILSLAEAVEAAGGTVEDTDRIYGAWRGTVAGKEHTIAAFAGYLFDIDLDADPVDARCLGTATKTDTSFFGFNDKVYLLNGTDYKSWDGDGETQFADVEPYIPLVQIATTPAGAGTLLENVNRLTLKKRVQFSPDGNADTFQLPEKDITSVDLVKLNDTETTAYTANLAAGNVKMTSAPGAGVNTLEITYTKGDDASDEVKKMRFSELFNGATDTRVFLYGDGSNKTIYSGIQYDTGEPSAEYFPDLYEVTVGEKNTPITALVRHYTRLMVYKPNSAYVITYGTMDLGDDSSTETAFYCQPVNRQFGNEAPGQVKLLENNPITLDVGSVYQWTSSNRSGYIVTNENNAKRVSDRVARTLRAATLKDIKTANIKHDHEYWFMLGGGKALILNYANDTWYIYEGLPFSLPLEIENETYGFGNDGDVLHFTADTRNDKGVEIDAYCATGAMDFDRDWLLKYSPMLYVAMQPQSNARVYVTVESNRRSDYPKKLVAYGIATFRHMDFKHFSFGTNRKPQVKRVKMKVKKATFYRLIFESKSSSAAATIIETDVKLRYAGSVK